MGRKCSRCVEAGSGEAGEPGRHLVGHSVEARVGNQLTGCFQGDHVIIKTFQTALWLLCVEGMARGQERKKHGGFKKLGGRSVSYGRDDLGSDSG